MFNLFKNKKQPYLGAARQHAFIVGTGRCGTTILASVLNSHSRICVPPELQIIFSYDGNGDRFYEKSISGELEKFRARHFSRLSELVCPYEIMQFFDHVRHFKGLSYPQTDLKKLLHELFDHICYDHGKDVFIEQTPWHGQRLDFLKELFPEMKVIHLVRDARDVALSYARTTWWSKDVGENLLQWENEVSIIKEFGKKNPDNFLEIRYEDLACNPEQELQKILDILGLTFELEMLDSSRLINYWAMFKGDSGSMQSKQYQQWEKSMKNVFFPDSIYSWKKNQDHDFNELVKPIKGTLESLGYSV
jgi:hypothetical protein